MREMVESFMMDLQDKICIGLEKLDGYGQFKEDQWHRKGGGGGRTRVIVGQHIEKGGVNFSAVFGALPDKISSALEIPAVEFYATGVSIVLHPVNPHMPIIHMNIRYFDTDAGHSWFGGGIDLTPHYIIPEDASFFHKALKETCDRHNSTYYTRFKQWADDYFFIPHRNETRGVGGIFYDRLSKDERHTMEDRFSFTKEVGQTFLPVYGYLFDKNAIRSFTEREKDWQYHRRGRYVEFNLVWDKGTKFGLDTAGRTESILMSMPPITKWSYNHKTILDSDEEKTLQWLKKGVDWINYKEV